MGFFPIRVHNPDTRLFRKGINGKKRSKPPAPHYKIHNPGRHHKKTKNIFQIVHFPKDTNLGNESFSSKKYNYSFTSESCGLCRDAICFPILQPDYTILDKIPDINKGYVINCISGDRLNIPDNSSDWHGVPFTGICIRS